VVVATQAGLISAQFIPAQQSSVIPAQQSSGIDARVSKVLDGDTFTLSGESPRIRIWGLDAPGWNHQGGSAATSTLRSLIAGNTLQCDVLDIDRQSHSASRLTGATSPPRRSARVRRENTAASREASMEPAE
jgi:endonuclease YncB( thermonuclease family)